MITSALSMANAGSPPDKNIGHALFTLPQMSFSPESERKQNTAFSPITKEICLVVIPCTVFYMYTPKIYNTAEHCWYNVM